MSRNGTDNPGPAYDLERSKRDTMESLDYSSIAGESETYLDVNTLSGTSVTGHAANSYSQIADATDTVAEMHLALLFLLSNPDDFHRALSSAPARGATTLAQWNAEYDNESLTEAESLMTTDAPSTNNQPTTTPLPFVVFADDAEVVLPQAHTASQLFGLERLEGIELEAAAGIPAISQLFLRWLALMPGGDHLNIIDPPGLTVMKIAGGRYRVTAAHRVVWTWMNEFVPLSRDDEVNSLQTGDLVTMTIVDVFETDNQGKLLSYCPTFDNRAIHKTHQTTETLRKKSSQVISLLGKAKNSETMAKILKSAQIMARAAKQKVDNAVSNYNSPQPKKKNPDSDQYSVDGEGELHEV